MVFEEQALWLTNTTHVYKFDMATKEVTQANTAFPEHIKSVSSGPQSFPTIIIKPKVSWWTDEVIDLQGNSVYFHQGLKIYKARWLIDNDFSYPEDDKLKFCGP